MQKQILMIGLTGLLLLSGYNKAQIVINGQTWKPKSKEQKEADKKAKEEEKALNRFSKSELKTLTDLSTYPDLNNDKQKLKDISNGFYIGTTYQTVEATYKRMDTYTASIQTINSIGDKYKDMFDARWQKCRQDEEYKSQQMARKDDLEEWHTTAKKNTNNFYQSVVEQKCYESAMKTLQEVKATTDNTRRLNKEYVNNASHSNASGDPYGSSGSSNNYYLVKDFSKELANLEYDQKCIDFIYGKESKESAGVINLKKECQTSIQEAKNEFKLAEQASIERAKLEKKKREEEEKNHEEGHMIADLEEAKNKPAPVDAYTGADKQTLKNLVIKQYKKEWPDSKIVKVYITSENWERKKGYEFYNNNAGKYDNSILFVQIVTESSDPLVIEHKMANIATCYLLKDNLNPGSGTKLKYDSGAFSYISQSKLK